MKGNKKLLEALNERLAEELAAINQYFVHAEMCEDWGYSALQSAIKQRSIQEMMHAAWPHFNRQESRGDASKRLERRG